MKETKVGNKLYALLLIILLVSLGTEIITAYTILNVIENARQNIMTMW